MEDSILYVPFQSEIAEGAQTVTYQSRRETGRSPIIVIRVGGQALHLPAGGSGAGLGHRAFPQQEQCDAAFFRQQRQPAAGHQIEAAGCPGNFQHHRPHMGAGQDVGRGGQRFAGIGRAQQEEVSGVAAQFQKTGGRQGAIFQRLIIRPDPEEWFFVSGLAHGLNGKAGGEAARTPVAREHFVQSAPPKPPTQNGIRHR